MSTYKHTENYRFSIAAEGTKDTKYLFRQDNRIYKIWYRVKKEKPQMDADERR